MQRAVPVVISGIVLGCVLWPLTWPADVDGFPLSSYPMFARPRDSSLSDVTHVVAVDAQGTRTIVPPTEVASGAVIQTLVTIQQSVNAGPVAARSFCKDVAARLPRSSLAPLRNATHVEIETARVDAIRYLGGDTTPIGHTTHARCRVP